MEKDKKKVVGAASAAPEAKAQAVEVKTKKKEGERSMKKDKKEKKEKKENAHVGKEVNKEAALVLTVQVSDIEKAAKKAGKLFTPGKKADKKAIQSGVETIFNAEVSELVGKAFMKLVKAAKLPYVKAVVDSMVAAQAKATDKTDKASAKVRKTEKTESVKKDKKSKKSKK
jgi:hypothetical protein